MTNNNDIPCACNCHNHTETIGEEDLYQLTLIIEYEFVSENIGYLIIADDSLLS